MTKLMGFPCVQAATSAAIREFLSETGAAVTSSFVVMSSAALTVTTATVLSVAGSVETKSNEIDDVLVQIEPGVVLDLDSPPFNHSADSGTAGTGDEPAVLETEAFDPIGDAGEAADELADNGYGGGSASGGGGAAGSAGGSSSGGFPLGGSGAIEGEDENESSNEANSPEENGRT